MAHQSPASIDYVVDGETYELCAVEGWLVFSLRIASEQELFESDGFRAPDAWFHPLGGAMATVTFATEEAFPDHPSAQAAFSEPDVFGGVSLLQATGTLRITTGATVWEWEHAVLESVTPSLPSDTTDEDGNIISTVVRAFAFRVPAVPTMA